MQPNSKNLKTVKKASQEIGVSQSFLRQLIREGQIKKYKANSAVFISMNEFEQLVQTSSAA